MYPSTNINGKQNQNLRVFIYSIKWFFIFSNLALKFIDPFVCIEQQGKKGLNDILRHPCSVINRFNLKSPLNVCQCNLRLFLCHNLSSCYLQYNKYLPSLIFLIYVLKITKMNSLRAIKNRKTFAPFLLKKDECSH